MRPIDLAYLSLVRRFSSSLAAGLSLGAALGLSGFLISLHLSLFESLSSRERSVDALIGPKSSSLRLLLDGLYYSGDGVSIIDYRLIQTLREEVGPKLIIPFAPYAQHRGRPVIGTEDSFLDLVRLEQGGASRVLTEGRWFNLHTDFPEAVIGAEAARELELKPDDVIQIASALRGSDGSPLWESRLRIVGILPESGSPRDLALFTPIEPAWDYHFRGHTEGLIHPSKMIMGAAWFAVVLDPEKPGQKDQLWEMVQMRSAGQWVEVEREMGLLMRLLGQGENVVWGLTLLALFLSASVVVLLLVERFETTRKDLGLYRALGYSRREIAASLFWEAFLLGIFGLSVGMVLERLANLMIPLVWSPVWLVFPSWPSIPLLILWGLTLATVLLIPLVPIVRLYRWVAHESLAAF